MLPLKKKKMMILCIVCVYWVPRQLRKARTRQFLPALCPCRTPGTRRERGKRRSKRILTWNAAFWEHPLHPKSVSLCLSRRSTLPSPLLPNMPLHILRFSPFAPLLGRFYFNEVSFFWYLGNCHLLDSNSTFDNVVLITLFVFFENNYG